MKKSDEFYILKQQYEMIGKRLEKLRKDIIDEISGEWEEMRVGSSYAIPGEDTYAILTVKRRQKIDDGALEQLLTEKGLYDQCTKTVVDHDLVEQLFIEGALEDSDLRSIDQGSPVLSLKVERREVIDDV